LGLDTEEKQETCSSIADWYGGEVKGGDRGGSSFIKSKLVDRQNHQEKVSPKRGANSKQPPRHPHTSLLWMPLLLSNSKEFARSGPPFPRSDRSLAGRQVELFVVSIITNTPNRHSRVRAFLGFGKRQIKAIGLAPCY
jgi:hypothetical protein